MSFQHHGLPEEPRPLSEKLRQLMAEAQGGEQKALVERFAGQRDGTANREFPNGRLSGEDDGSLTFVISSDPDTQIVQIDFAKPTAWVGMPPQQAIELAQLLIRHARGISREPLRINLH